MPSDPGKDLREIVGMIDGYGQGERLDFGATLVADAVLPLFSHLTGKVRVEARMEAAKRIYVARAAMQELGFPSIDIDRSCVNGMDEVRINHDRIREEEIEKQC